MKEEIIIGKLGDQLADIFAKGQQRTLSMEQVEALRSAARVTADLIKRLTRATVLEALLELQENVAKGFEGVEADIEQLKATSLHTAPEASND